MSVREILPRAALVVGGGFALGLAFPRTDWNGAAWIALVPVLVIALAQPPRPAVAWGWAFGCVYFLVLLRWLNFTFLTYSAIPWPLTYVPTFLLAAYLGLYVGLVVGAVAWLAARRSATWGLAAAPFLWVAAEWVRGHLLGGFPWGTLGYSQYLRLPVIQIAEIGGVHAVSFVIVAVNVALTGCLILSWRRALGGLGLAGLLIGATLAFGAARLAAPLPAPEATVAIVQPSIEQPVKFEPGHARQTLAVYFALTRQAAQSRPDLIVWPETATPTVLRRDGELVRTLAALSAEYRVPLLVGSIDVTDAPPRRLRNSAFLLTEGGIQDRYDKIHLVPFGEYVPLSSVLGFVRGWAEFIAELEPGTRTLVFPGPPAPFGVVICYEGIFPDLVRELVRSGARLMVNITNDAWFGRTSGPEQHLAMYPFRAIEHRVAVVRAANTGVSAFIAPTGQITRRTNLFERTTLVERLPLRVGRTLYGRIGDWPAWLGLAVSAATLGAAWRRR